MARRRGLTIGGIRRLRGVGKDCEGWPNTVGIRDDGPGEGTESEGDCRGLPWMADDCGGC